MEILDFVIIAAVVLTGHIVLAFFVLHISAKMDNRHTKIPPIRERAFKP